MVVEQLLTARTITEISVWQMIRIYERECRKHTAFSEVAGSLEAGTYGLPIGKLRIGYYRPQASSNLTENGETDPVKAHIKCTVTDGQVIVLGSGNLDRASWYTSQELGIALYGKDVVVPIWDTLEQALKGRVEEYYGY